MEIIAMSHSLNPPSAKSIMTEGEIRPTSAIVIYRMIFPLAPYIQAVTGGTLQNTQKNPSSYNKLG